MKGSVGKAGETATKEAETGDYVAEREKRQQTTFITIVNNQSFYFVIARKKVEKATKGCLQNREAETCVCV